MVKMRDCRDCLDFNGFFSFGCLKCVHYYATKKKSENFDRVVKYKPSKEELEHFKRLWSDI